MREFVGEPVDVGDEGRVVGDEALEAPELSAAASDGLGYPRHSPLRLLRREYGTQRRRRPLPRRSHRFPLSTPPGQKNCYAPDCKLSTAGASRASAPSRRRALELAPAYGPAPRLIGWPSACSSRFSHHSRGKGRGPATRKAMNLTGPTGGRLPVDGGWDTERWRGENLENERDAAVAASAARWRSGSSA